MTNRVTGVCYNRSMKEKESKMNTQWKSTIGNLRTYQGDIVHVISESEYWNEAKVMFTSPKENQPTGIFTVGLPRLKKLGQN